MLGNWEIGGIADENKINCTLIQSKLTYKISIGIGISICFNILSNQACVLNMICGMCFCYTSEYLFLLKSNVIFPKTMAWLIILH